MDKKDCSFQNCRKFNDVRRDGLSGSKPWSIATYPWMNIKPSRKRGPPSLTGVVIEREHVYDICGQEEDDFGTDQP